MDVKVIEVLIREYAAFLPSELNPREWTVLGQKRSGVFELFSDRVMSDLIRYDFTVDIPNKLSYNGDLYLYPGPFYRRKGLGRRLINFRESICAALGIEDIIININKNPGFWEHMNYESLSPTRQEEIRGKTGIGFPDKWKNPVHKTILPERVQPQIQHIFPKISS